MIAQTSSAVPASTLPGGVDAGSAFTMLQWLEQRPWAIMLVCFLAVGAWLLYWIPRFFKGYAKRYDATLAHFQAEREQAREQHAKLLEAGNDRTARTIEAFQSESAEDRRSCDERTTRAIGEITREIRDVVRRKDDR